jgi:hypothetical protein
LIKESFKTLSLSLFLRDGITYFYISIWRNLMGLFQWLGKLLDDLIEWLGRAVKAFLEKLIWALQELWEATIAAILLAAFGAGTILYAIFYAGSALGTTIMEVWDPRYFDSQPSKVIEIEQAPEASPLPKYRDEAKKVLLKNWS